MDLGTPLGLAFASGINAYLPLLSLAISTRFLHLDKVNPQFAFITQDWFIIALVILTLIDFVADKFPVIDHTWDAIHTVIRPIAGALVAAASYSQFHLPGIKISAASSQIPQAMLTDMSSSHILGTIVAAANAVSTLGPYSRRPACPHESYCQSNNTVGFDIHNRRPSQRGTESGRGYTGLNNCPALPACSNHHAHPARIIPYCLWPTPLVGVEQAAEETWRFFLTVTSRTSPSSTGSRRSSRATRSFTRT